MRGRSGRRRAAWIIVFSLFVLASGALPPADAAHAGQTFTRSYEATSAVATGGAGSPGGFAGFAVCSNDQDTVADTAACVRYRSTAGHGWDYRGWEFEVHVQDMVFGAEAWYLIAIDTLGNSAVDCTPSSPNVCILAKGTTRATIPASAQGEVLRILPLSYHQTGPPCCADSAATRGSITVTFPA